VTPSPTSGPSVVNLDQINGLASDAEWIRFEGNTYHTVDDGLYRFVKICHGVESVRNVIRVNDRHFTTIKSRLELLSALSKLHVHGAVDNDPNPNDTSYDEKYIVDLKSRAISQGFLSAECGYIAGLGVRLMRDNLGDAEQRHQNARCIHVDADASLHLDYDAGHQLMEVRDPLTTSMVLVDLDLGYIFYVCDNGSKSCSFAKMHLLSAQEFWKAVHDNLKPGFLPLSKGEIDPNYKDCPWLDWRFWTETDKWGWYKQMFSGRPPRVSPPDTAYCWQGS
jgi:hypothetical protein